MPSKHVAHKRKQLATLFVEQEGLCHWCKEPMWLAFVGPPKNEPEFARRATIDHLDDRYSPERGKHGGGKERRRVAACHQCNSTRISEARARMPIEEIRERSGRNARTEDVRGGEDKPA